MHLYPKNFCILILTLLCSGICLDPVHSQDAAKTPDNRVIADAYEPGIGAPAGKIRLVKGEVFITHPDGEKAYRAAAETPLYQGDAVIAYTGGMASLNLNDGSQMTLASDSRIVISKSVYDPKRQTRSSFIRMGLGKVRFWVRKLTGYEKSEFKIKTKTAVLGVRGSDFIVKSTETATEVITLEETRLEVVSLAAPDKDPTILSDFEKTVIEIDRIPSEVEEILREEADAFMRELPVMPEMEETVPEAASEMESVEIHVPAEAVVEPDVEEDMETIESLEAPEASGEAEEGADDDSEDADEAGDMEDDMSDDMEEDLDYDMGDEMMDFSDDMEAVEEIDDIQEHVQEQLGEEAVDETVQYGGAPEFPEPPPNPKLQD